MAVALPEGGSIRRRAPSSGRQNRFPDAISALAAVQNSQLTPPPMPNIEIPPLHQLPPPQPVSVPDPLAMLARAVSQFQGMPTLNTIQLLANLATAHAQNILQSRLQAQEQALRQALGLGDLAMSRAQLALERAQAERQGWFQSQQLRQEAARQRLELRELQREEEDMRRRTALGYVIDVINQSGSPQAARAQIDVIFSVYPELRAYISQAQIEALIRAKWPEEGQQQTSQQAGGTLMDRLQSQFRMSMPWTYSSLERLLSQYYR